MDTYRLGQVLREGPRATSYRAVRASDGRAVVLKVLHARLCRPEDRDRLLHEYEIGRTLIGLGVVLEPLALTVCNGSMALELADFDGLPIERLAAAPMPVEAFLRLAVRVAGAVSEIHTRGVIHKDLKPGHILYAADRDEVRITGFGLASRAVREQPNPRSLRLVEGSLPYISPEQTGHMNRSVDTRSDLYSLGILFYQLLTGHLPFRADDPAGWVHGHLARKPTPPTTERPELPSTLSAIVVKLLAKVPDDRYQTAFGLARDLERCLVEWRAFARLDPFPLGEHDLSERLLIPQKLYGRADECAALSAAFGRVVGSGRAQLLLVAGPSGIGKSAVVHQLRRPVLEQRGLFACGKFEQQRREVPYFTLIQALRELVLDILARSELEIASWRRGLQAALGENAQLIVELIPQLALVIGTPSPVAALPPAEAEHRLRLVFRHLFAALSTRTHPFTLFLDDLQWADAASLKLLVDLVTHGERLHLLVVGAYRANEVDDTHPLAAAIEEARAGGAVADEIVLGPLAEPEMCQLIADALRCSLASAAPLARLVREKSGGNPFFAIQFLTMLHEQGLIAVDHEANCWRWDVARIAGQRYTDNVAELMVAKLRALPAATQHALEVAACFGSSVDVDALVLAVGPDIEAALGPAVDDDLLHRQDRTYRFLHDRVQEAAYSLIAEDARAATHLGIGRRLLAATPPEQLDEKSFEIANHLNRAAPLIDSREERERVAALDLVAGRRAKSATAYVSALSYFSAGAALLDEGAWSRAYELVFALELQRAECELLTGELAAADERLCRLMARARDLVDAAAVTCVRIELYVTLGRTDRSVAACLEYLRRLGIDWSPHPSDAEVEREYQNMWRLLGERPLESLAQLPEATSDSWRAAIDVLTAIQPAAHFTDANLHALVVARTACINLQHGSSDASCVAYVAIGIVLGARFGDYQAGLRFSKLAVDIVEKRRLLRHQGRVYFVRGFLVSPWSEPLRGGLELLERAFKAALEAGDLTHCSYSLNCTTSLLLAEGAPLGCVQRKIDEALDFVGRVKFGLVADFIAAKAQLVRQLRGLTRDFSSFDEASFDEATFEARMEADPERCLSACSYWIRKLQGRFFAGEYAAALAAAERAQSLLWSLVGFIEVAEYHFYRGLALAAGGERPDRRRELQAHLAQLESWARSCPETFAGRAALLAAEVARLDGRGGDAMRSYQDAIAHARAGGFVHDEALAFEIAARFYRADGFEVFADAYLREASVRYLRWGAEGKVRQLERLHPQLVERPPIASAPTVTMRSEQLDLLAVVKASQTISSVMVRDQLLHTLLDLVLEQGAARRAHLVLARSGQGAVVAEATLDATSASSRSAEAPEPTVPQSILDYVERTHECVRIDDATVDAGRFGDDPYLAARRPRSLLCLPILHRGELTAILYLENDLVPGAFTPEGLTALELLAAQAAISLENVHLLERERTARVNAEAAGRRAHLLGEATALISSTLDYRGVFGALARLCARSFADWALIDLVDGERVIRLAGAHRCAEKEPLLRELAELYPPGHGSTAPAAMVLATGEPLLLQDIGEADLATMCVDERHAALIRALGARSALVVPLVARDVGLGALTFVAATPHAFERADLDLARELGRRAALALDNARLLEQTQRALSLRDEFLSVASHELRTPLTSLQLTVDSLLDMEIPAQGEPMPVERLGRSLERVRRKTDRLRQLVGELLDVTRIERGQLDVRPAPVDLAVLVREVVERFAAELATAQCPVSIACDQPAMGSWDASRIDQVVTNLLSNAIKFGPHQPIDVRIAVVDGFVRLEVQDCGIGIDPTRLPFVFERFERAVSARHYGGLGLGLYIARSIVQAHGGRIRVESTLGRGSTFIVELPSLRSAAEDATALQGGADPRL